VIAKALGPRRTRNELIPFLHGKSILIIFNIKYKELLDDEEEVLKTLFEQISKPEFLKLIGGKKYVLHLIELL